VREAGGGGVDIQSRPRSQTWQARVVELQEAPAEGTVTGCRAGALTRLVGTEQAEEGHWSRRIRQCWQGTGVLVLELGKIKAASGLQLCSALLCRDRDGQGTTNQSNPP